MSVRFLGRSKALLAATALTATMAVGCTAGQWEPKAPPAAGVQQDTADGFKVRNLLIIADSTGKAVLEGSIVADRAFTLNDAGYSAEQPDGSWSTAAPLPISQATSEQNKLTLGGPSNAFQAPELTPGRLAVVGLQFDEGAKVQLEVPVYDASHPDFATAWAQATQG